MAVLHVHEAASPPRAPSLHGGACGMHDKIGLRQAQQHKIPNAKVYTPRE
jgi:hypothetical protein